MDLKTPTTSAKSYMYDNRLLIKEPEVQQFMRKKRKEWKKKQKDEVALSHTAMRAKKEKLEALEMERRARLCSEGVNGPEKSEANRRPQWDSTILLPASDINGPWTNISELTTEIDFPLPKPVDVEKFPDLCIEDEKTDELLDCNKANRSKTPSIKAGIPYERNIFLAKAGSSRGKKIPGNKYTYNDASYKNPISSQSTEKRKPKKRHTISKFIKNDVSTKKVQCCSQKSRRDNTRKPIQSSNSKQQKEILASRQLLAHKVAHVTSVFLDSHPKTRLPNKRKITTVSPNDYERRNKIPTSRKMCLSEVDSLNPSTQGTHLARSKNLGDKKDGNLSQKPNDTRCITYHLEKLPYKYEPEVLNERKRVALLKLLAQQLVKRIDAAQSCSSSQPYIGNVQEHAFLLRSNLVKFHRKLRRIEKALESECPQNLSKKTCGYIVLPCKLQRNYGSSSIVVNQKEESEEYCNLLELRNTIPDQNVVSCSSSSDVSFHASISSTVSVSNGIISSERSVSSYISGGLGKGQRRHHCFIDSLNSSDDQRLERIWYNGGHGQGIQAWDHQLLVKELEKLDGEIRDTKARMANKLSLVASGVDKDLAMPYTSNGLGCDDHVQYSSKKERGQMGDSDTLRDSEDNLNIQIDDPPFSDSIELSARNIIHRKQGESEEGKKSKDDVSRVDKDCSANDRRNMNSYQQELIDSSVCAIDAEPNQVEDYNTTLIRTPNSNVSTDLTTGNVLHLNEATKGLGNMRSCIKSELKNELLNNELPMDVTTTEIVPESHIEKEYLAESITDILMEDLVEHELSDFLCQYGPLSQQGTWIGEGILSSERKVEHVFLGKSCIGSNNDKLSNMHRSEAHSIKVECSVEHVLNKSHIKAKNRNLVQSHEQSGTRIITVEYRNGSQTHGDPMNNQFDTHRESNDAAIETFRAISKKLVEKFVDIAFEICGLNSSSLVDVYTAEKTMAMLVVELMSKGMFEVEDTLYGKLLIDRPHLKQILISKVSEQADATCEDGFSLEHMLERYVDEQDWRKPYFEMMEVTENICEQILQDMIENFVDDIAEPIGIREVKVIS